MENNNYNPSDSLMLESDEKLPMSEPDSPESSCSLIFKEGEWQMPLDEGDLNYKGFKPKRPQPYCTCSRPVPLQLIFIVLDV